MHVVPPAPPRRTAPARRGWERFAATRAGRFTVDTFVAARAVLRGFRGEQLGSRAAALTYISIFSLVPLLTVALALLHALHQGAFQRRLRGLIFEVLAPGVREESAAFLERFLSRGSTTAIGSVGFLALLVSAASLLRHVEAALNELWGVRQKRPFALRLAAYVAMLLFGPLLAAASLSGTGALRALVLDTRVSFAPQLLTLGTGVLSAAGLTLLYLWAPHAHVRLRSALAGGLVAGAAWTAAKAGYVAFAAHSFRYNPLYASLGALPLFLAWVHLSWLVILFGARLAYAVEHASFRDSLAVFGDHPRARELVAARIAQEVTRAWLEGRPGPAPRELATQLRVPEALLAEVVVQLRAAGLLQPGRRGGLQPGRPVEQLTLSDVWVAVHGSGARAAPSPRTAGCAGDFEALECLLLEADAAGIRVLERTGWLDLARAPSAGAPEAPTPAIPAKTGGGRKV
ncbi:YihY family inner membrane protein [Aggregicoccus sp. 17bor-14]|uniref:YhjD/YihY/BrkB family envelope integrity protein n=1 Tax=Myxococcaceae TaxID=31 RepID=UPI00129C1783|nr:MULTISPECIES: YhjD/YihY/BrkB family envelope integrity protein [Myxococcaceae]MBF5044378.1 YihY family inner membrane protein [Simulacricoccus sp. 17bor-14]MRI90125.1 YihY family inner membrane protein [Aggregicoccus sp. 17bor-14]